MDYFEKEFYYYKTLGLCEELNLKKATTAKIVGRNRPIFISELSFQILKKNIKEEDWSNYINDSGNVVVVPDNRMYDSVDLATMNFNSLIVGFIISGILFNICLVIELTKEKRGQKDE